MRQAMEASATVLARAQRARMKAEDVRKRADDTLIAARRRRAEHDGHLEAVLTHSLAGKPLAHGLLDVWRAGYTRGWRDSERD